MNIKKKLQIVDILFKTLEGEELTDEHIWQALDSIVQNPIKRAKFREGMLKKYGEDVFVRRAGNLKGGPSGLPNKFIATIEVAE